MYNLKILKIFVCMYNFKICVKAEGRKEKSLFYPKTINSLETSIVFTNIIGRKKLLSLENNFFLKCVLQGELVTHFPVLRLSVVFFKGQNWAEK